MLPLRALSLVAWVGAAVAHLQVHDETFTPELVLEVTAQDVKINCEVRHSVVVNGTVPGPTLHLREGHTTWIRVYNRMSDHNLTMHWHGLSQRAAPFSDGTPLVSQWPIPPGHFFDYQLRPVLGDGGTYYYHSHVGMQLSTAHGAIIVKDARAAPHRYDGELLMVLGDYYNKTDDEMQSGLLGDPFKWSGEPQAITVQGHSGKKGFGEAEDASCAPAVLEVEPGRTYRVRVVGATTLSMVKMGIEDHGDALQAVEADGADARPVAVDHIQVAAGQRYSFLLRTKTADEVRASGRRNFWIRYESRDRPQINTGYALLRYKGVRSSSSSSSSSRNEQDHLPAALPASSPVTLSNDTASYLEYALHPLLDSVAAEFPRLHEVTRTVVIQVNQRLETGTLVNGTTINGTLVWDENGAPWQENVQAGARQVPYLVEEYLTGRTPDYAAATTSHAGFDPATRAFPARVGEVIDIVWASNSGPLGSFDTHPMHIHGAHAFNLGSGPGHYDPVANEARLFRDGPDPPLRRDTTVLYRYRRTAPPHTTDGWRAWRIRITEEDVGTWMMHCHIAQHAVMGMNTVWVYGTADDIRRRFPDPPYVAGYLKYGGDAYGREGRNPHVYHFLDDDDEKL